VAVVGVLSLAFRGVHLFLNDEVVNDELGLFVCSLLDGLIISFQLLE
jgi:hypothetical protein